MPGSPRNRARKIAARIHSDEVSGDWMIRPPPWKRDEPAKAEPSEQDLTAAWWREEVENLNRAAKERGEQADSGSDAVLASQARVFGALGVPPDVAAALMGIPEGAFLGRFANEYGVGSAAMIGQVAANLLRIATSGKDRYAVKAAIEIMNRRGGEPWRPPAQKLEVERTEKPRNLIDSSKLTYEERQALKAIILAANAREQQAALEHDA